MHATIDLEKEFLKIGQDPSQEQNLILENVHNEIKRLNEADRLHFECVFPESAKALRPIANIVSHKLDRSRVFTYDQIGTICHKYHLRFLPTRLYRGALPSDVIVKIREFESTMEARGSTYRIVAPVTAFNLPVRVDPLLFAELEEKKLYYLIHTWGSDLSIWRRISVLLWHSVWVPVALGSVAAIIATHSSWWWSILGVVLVVCAWTGTMLTFEENWDSETL